MFQPVAFLPLILLWVLSIVLCLVMTLCSSVLLCSTSTICSASTILQPSTPVAGSGSYALHTILGREVVFFVQEGRPSVDRHPPHHIILISQLVLPISTDILNNWLPNENSKAWHLSHKSARWWKLWREIWTKVKAFKSKGIEWMLVSAWPSGWPGCTGREGAFALWASLTHGSSWMEIALSSWMEIALSMLSVPISR